MIWKIAIAAQMLAMAWAFGAEPPVATPGAPGGEAKKAPQARPSRRPVQPPRPTVRRDTEGTEAHDRFEAEISIPSKYTLDGKPLEVDPD